MDAVEIAEALIRLSLLTICYPLTCSAEIKQNVALNKPTSQSSTWGQTVRGVWRSYPSSLAVDGNTNGNFIDGNTCTHTKGFEKDPAWWSVDLEQVYLISEIHITNRENRAHTEEERLGNFSISVDDGSRIIFTHVNSTWNLRGEYEIVLQPPVWAKVLTVFLPSVYRHLHNILTLCEVQVYAFKIPCVVPQLPNGYFTVLNGSSEMNTSMTPICDKGYRANINGELATDSTPNAIMCSPDGSWNGTAACTEIKQNVALNKPTSQSSTWGQTVRGVWRSYPSSLAVDGNTNGNFIDGNTCTHTKGFEKEPAWWSVDLEQVYLISEIHITNRENRAHTEEERLGNFSISVDDGSRIIFTHVNSTWNLRGEYEIVLQPPVWAKVLTVFLPSEYRHLHNILTLCEVQVYALQIPCVVPQLPNGYFTVLNGSSEMNTSMTPICNNGYRAKINGEFETDSTPNAIMCSPDGSWNGTAACTGVRCQDLPAADHGHYILSSGPKLQYPATYTLVCDPGYKADPQFTCQSISCNIDGSWSTPSHYCAVDGCGLPDSPSHGTYKLSGTEFGDTADMVCDEGYELLQPSVRTCLKNGSWSGPMIDCKGIQCQDLPAVEHGHYVILSGSEQQYPTTYTLVCDPGFEINPRSTCPTISCNIEGRWSTPSHYCAVDGCGLPDSPSHGTYKLSGTEFGDTADMVCHEGYELLQPSVRTCLKNGSWSGEIVNCQKRKKTAVNATTRMSHFPSLPWTTVAVVMAAVGGVVILVLVTVLIARSHKRRTRSRERRGQAYRSESFAQLCNHQNEENNETEDKYTGEGRSSITKADLFFETPM